MFVAVLLLPAPAAAQKEDVNRRNPDGTTALHWAVYNGDAAETRRLLRAGADVSIVSKYGVSPMGLAAVGSSRVDLQACKLEYSIVSPK